MTRKTFRALVLADPKGRSPTQIAAAASISRSYLYGMMMGAKSAPKPWVVTRLSNALARTESTIRKALEATSEQAQDPDSK